MVTLEAGLAEAHNRLRTFKNSVSADVQGVTNTEDRTSSAACRDAVCSLKRIVLNGQKSENQLELGQLWTMQFAVGTDHMKFSEMTRNLLPFWDESCWSVERGPQKTIELRTFNQRPLFQVRASLKGAGHW